MNREITDSQWATSFLANAYTEKQFRGFSEDMSDITRELVSKLEEVRKKERERIIEEIREEFFKKINKRWDDRDAIPICIAFNVVIEDKIKNIK